MFQQLRDDPATDNWIALHSLDVANHISQIRGEIDFVVLVPKLGVLCLEIKGARKIARMDGVWYYGESAVPDHRGPFKQASNAMHSIRKTIKARQPGLSDIMFCHGVVFPYVVFSQESPEWHSWQLIDASEYQTEPISRLVADLLRRYREFFAGQTSASWFSPGSGVPTVEQCEQIASILRPEFEFYQSPQSRTTERTLELKRYSEEQFQALDAMERNPRVLFAGPAGTGKTLLAIEAARRASANGQRALLVCYNRLLGRWLGEQIEPIANVVTARTLHGLMLEFADVRVPETAGEGFWLLDLPKAATAKIGTLDRPKADVLVVDEAQDMFFSDEYTVFLDQCLLNGLGGGKWRIFGDFENQAIYSHGRRARGSIADALISSAPEYSLRVNCRNPPRIVEFIHLLGKLKPHYSSIRRTDNEIEPQVLIYQNSEHQLRLLAAAIRSSKRRNYEPNEIVILSARAAERSAAAYLASEGEFDMCPLGSSWEEGKIRYGSIHQFKGLESPVVIVTDFERLSSEADSSLLYTSITRALESLTLLVHQDLRQTLLESLGTGD